jgi:sugar phosphate isomerase/epimerase
MIYVSSTNPGKKIIRESIEELYKNGFTNIELTGGTRYYANVCEDIISLKKEYGLNFLIHNYFPPPREDFVLNLASPDKIISEKSIDFCKGAIDLSRSIDAQKVSFHSGFLLDIAVNQLGHEIKKKQIYEKDMAIDCLHEAYNELVDYSCGDIEIHLENNVFSFKNAKNFGDVNPFLLTDYSDYCSMKNEFAFHLLLDVAHLWISSNTLNLDFEVQLEKMLAVSDYIHLSHNDGAHDAHLPFTAGSAILEKLSKFNLKNKIITLEIMSDMPNLKQSYELIKTISGK